MVMRTEAPYRQSRRAQFLARYCISVAARKARVVWRWRRALHSEGADEGLVFLLHYLYHLTFGLHTSAARQRDHAPCRR